MPLTSNTILTGEFRDLSDGAKLPRFIRNNKKLAKAEEQYRRQQKMAITLKMRKAHVLNCFVDSKENAIPQIINVLEEQKRVKY